MGHAATARTRAKGSALLEFAIALPLLVVFVVGIYDFSGAYNQKQKISHAAQEGAIVAGAQPMLDIDPANGNPDSLQPVVTLISDSLTANNVLRTNCDPVVAAWVSGVKWRYTTTCGVDTLTILINRGVIVDAGPPAIIGTTVEVSYPYRWRFSSVIQLIVPGAAYAATTILDESATVHNQT
jgi:Flp pilus assembly protein TadG